MSIANNYGLAAEMIKGLCQKNVETSACISLGLRKAFDSVRWEAVRSTLLAMGFSQYFTKPVMNYVTTVRFSILVEAEPTMEFMGEKSL